MYYGAEDDPKNPVWVLPARRTIGSQVMIEHSREESSEVDGERGREGGMD